jgi:CheY-like chemotaxis protein
MKIMIADDDIFIVDLLTNYLEITGHNLIFASNSKEIEEKAASEKPDVIFLDLHMPGIKEETENTVKIPPSIQNIPIVLLTGTSNEKLAELGLKDWTILKKPIEFEKLDAVLQKIQQANPA